MEMNVQIMEQVIPVSDEEKDKVEDEDELINDEEGDIPQFAETVRAETVKYESMTSLANRIGVPPARVFKMMKMEK